MEESKTKKNMFSLFSEEIWFFPFFYVMYIFPGKNNNETRTMWYGKQEKQRLSIFIFVVFLLTFFFLHYNNIMFYVVKSLERKIEVEKKIDLLSHVFSTETTPHTMFMVLLLVLLLFYFYFLSSYHSSDPIPFKRHLSVFFFIQFIALILQYKTKINE